MFFNLPSSGQISPKSFESVHVKSFESTGDFSYYKKGDTTFIAIPTINNGRVLIRHNKSSVESITTADLINFNNNATETNVDELNVPWVHMDAKLDLQQHFKEYLPETLTKSFETILINRPLKISSWIQKVTFNMSDMGVEASAATAMVGQSESCAMLPRNSLIVNIDSPFSFALTLVVNGTDIPLFLGIVENRDDLILE